MADKNYIPPHDLNTEKQLLAALLTVPDAAPEILALIQKPEVFYHPPHALIYSAAQDLYSDSKPIDMLSVAGQLRSTGKIDQAGGEAYTLQLASEVGSVAKLEYHCRVLLQFYLKREMYRSAANLAKDAVKDTTDVFELMDGYQVMLDRLNSEISTSDVLSWHDILKAIREDVEQLSNREGGVTGVPSGLSDLDRQMNGWQGGELIILAARPGMGKTAMAVSWLVNAAKAGVPVAVFQLEMSDVQFGKRILANEAKGLHANHFYKHGLSKPEEWDKFMRVLDDTQDLPLHILPKPGMNVFECTREARRLKKKHDIGLVVVDYLQLMGGANKGRNSNREQEISEVSRELKKLSLEINVPVVALSQLSRAVETRGGDKRPRLSDLRESGSIEQDADAVLFLYRPEYYAIDTMENGESSDGKCEVIIAKHRNGGLGVVNVGFDDNKVRFHDLNQFENEQSPYPISQDIGGDDDSPFA